MKFLKPAVVAAAALSATFAYAGGPVIIEEGNDELIEAAPSRSGVILPVIGLLVLACLVACGGGGGDGGAGGDVDGGGDDPKK
jgi:hypothetical protein